MPKCEVTQEDISEGSRLGAKILQAMIAPEAGLAEDARNLRNRAAEYLRRGIEEVRAAAWFLFRNDDSSMGNYPSLFIRKRKKNGNGKGTGKDSVALVVEQPTSVPDEAAAYAPTEQALVL